MPSFCRISVVLLVGLSNMGCVSMGPQAMTAEYQTARHDYPGFSILPPQGKGWSQIPTDPGRLAFVKEMEPGHTFVASVQVVHLAQSWKDPDGYLKVIKEGKSADTDPQRFKTVVGEYALDKKFGAYCVRFHSVMEDHQAAHKNAEGFEVMETRGFGCLHPQRQDLYYDLVFSERNDPGKGDPSASTAAEQFLDGFAFGEIGGSRE